MPKQRLVYIDVAKLLAIYLVVLGHVIVKQFSDAYYGDPLYVIIYTFHMPLFMMMSGFFASSVLKLDFSGLLKKKMVRLLLPAVSCTVVCLAYFFLTSDSVDIRDEFIGNSWFLKTLFMCQVTFWVVKRVKLPDIVLFIGSWTIILLVPHSYSLQYNWMYPFFWIGYFLRKNIWLLEKHCGKIAVGSSLIFVCALLVLFRCHFSTGILPMSGMLISQAPILLFKLIVGGGGSVMSIAWCKLAYTAAPKSLGHLSRYGRYTLGIYVTQTFLVENVSHDVYQFHCDSVWAKYFAAVVLSVLFTTLCILVIKALARVKLLDVVFFGGQYRRLN